MKYVQEYEEIRIWYKRPSTNHYL